MARLGKTDVLIVYRSEAPVHMMQGESVETRVRVCQSDLRPAFLDIILSSEHQTYLLDKQVSLQY